MGKQAKGRDRQTGKKQGMFVIMQGVLGRIAMTIALICYLMLEWSADDFLVRSFSKKPPEAVSSDKAYYPVDVYPGAKTEEHELFQVNEEKALWEYHFASIADSPSKVVADFYKRNLSDAKIETDPEYQATEFTYKPKSAKTEDEHVKVIVQPMQGGKTLVQVEEVVKSGAALPGWKFRMWFIRLFFLGVVVGALFLLDRFLKSKGGGAQQES